MRQGIDRLKAPVAGRMAVTALMFVLFAWGFSSFGFAKPGFFALAAVVCVEAALLFWRVKRSRNNQAKAEQQYKLLDDLKQQEFALSYEEAKLDGKLDRWQELK